MASPICIARMWHYSYCGRWAAVVHSGVRYELTRTSRLNNTSGVRDISHVAFNVLSVQWFVAVWLELTVSFITVLCFNLYCQRSQVKHIIQRTVTTAERTWATRIETFCWYAMISVFAIVCIVICWTVVKRRKAVLDSLFRKSKTWELKFLWSKFLLLCLLV